MTKAFNHPLSATLQEVSALALVKVNERLKLGLWGITMPLKELFIDDTQATQTLTKLLQTLVNFCIVEAMNELNVDGKAVGADGYDYIFNLNDTRYEVEFKLIAGTDSMKASFATGNKISALTDDDGNCIGKKSPLVWCIKYVMGDDNDICQFASALTNSERFFSESSGWHSGEGNTDSYSQLHIAKSEVLAVDLLHGKLHPARKYYHLLTTNA